MNQKFFTVFIQFFAGLFFLAVALIMFTAGKQIEENATRLRQYSELSGVIQVFFVIQVSVLVFFGLHAIWFALSQLIGQKPKVVGQTKPKNEGGQ